MIEVEIFCLHITYRDQIEVVPLKNLAVLKFDEKDSFGYNKELERIGKIFLKI